MLKYTQPKMMIEEFNQTDVITTSGLTFSDNGDALKLNWADDFRWSEK